MRIDSKVTSVLYIYDPCSKRLYLNNTRALWFPQPSNFQPMLSKLKVFKNLYKRVFFHLAN